MTKIGYAALAEKRATIGKGVDAMTVIRFIEHNVDAGSARLGPEHLADLEEQAAYYDDEENHPFRQLIDAIRQYGEICVWPIYDNFRKSAEGDSHEAMKK